MITNKNLKLVVKIDILKLWIHKLMFYNLSKQVDAMPSKNQVLHKLNYCKFIE